MPTAAVQVQNNFTEGLKTEFTGLNFPANAATDTENCIYTMTGDVKRRLGFDYEKNYASNSIGSGNAAMSSFKWDNVGGDGSTQIVVMQVGFFLYFYRSSTATIASPLSNQILGSVINLNNFLASGSAANTSLSECVFAAGNGFLFVYHPDCDPFYCVYNNGVITPNVINIQIRDFSGIVEKGIPDNFRPLVLTQEHNYNLLNQGWNSAATWSAISTTGNNYNASGIEDFDVGSNSLPISVGSNVAIVINDGGPFQGLGMSATILSYVGNVIRVNIYGSSGTAGLATLHSNWLIYPISLGTLDAWHSVTNNYPSNSDVWWNYKNSTNQFSPATMYSNVTVDIGPAPKGHFVISAFNQNASVTAGVPGLTPISTTARPKTGTWFQGRVWFAGVDASQQATGDAAYYTWSESIYFSQIVSDPSHFGRCYQNNDPTSQTLFSLLSDDGGVIVIQGSGSIYNLFPVQNGMLVFAANGIWFITGSQGIGFTANDYTITKISSIRSISSCSFVDVQSLPIFWNEEGIYMVAPAQHGLGMTVNPLTVGTIKSFYDKIPQSSKQYARGAYNPISYTVEWTYRTTEEIDVTSRYQFDGVLNFNTYTKAFYPYLLSKTGTTPFVHGIEYVSSPGGSTAPSPTFKYPCSQGTTFTFAEEYKTNYLDWTTFNSSGFDYLSYFVTGYALDGQAMKRFYLQYLNMFSRTGEPTSYRLQGIWDYATSGNSGKYSREQLITNGLTNFGMKARRHRIRGNGVALQIRVSSVTGMPFDIIGWSALPDVNVSA